MHRRKTRVKSKKNMAGELKCDKVETSQVGLYSCGAQCAQESLRKENKSVTHRIIRNNSGIQVTTG